MSRSTTTPALLAVGLVLGCVGAILLVIGVQALPVYAAIIVGMVVTTAAIVRVGATQREARADTHLVMPVPPPSSETLLEMMEPVAACPSCGATDVQGAVLQRAVEAIECPRCGYLGEARLFWRKQEYAEYVQALAR